jgi:hypothetical protein
MYENHYDYLNKHLKVFFDALGIPYSPGIIGAHGDKAYGYRGEWKDAGIPFHKGVAVYLLTHENPFSKEVRDTPNGWVAPVDWVVQNYHRFKDKLPD